MAALSPAAAHHRAQIGALTRAIRAGERPADDPALTDAQRNLRAARTEDYILRSSGNVATSSSLITTIWPSSDSKARAMSRYSTTSPSSSHTRW
jgi:hypothetical protein